MGRRYLLDASMDLYRGETSFLDWREQACLAWAANDAYGAGRTVQGQADATKSEFQYILSIE